MSHKLYVLQLKLYFMVKNVLRNYKGKDEELPVMAGYVEYSFVRDQADFINFSPKFSSDYLLAYQAKTNAVRELIFSATETAKLKEATNLLYGTLDEVLAMDSGIQPFRKLIATIKSHWSGIVVYFDTGITNGVLEGFNIIRFSRLKEEPGDIGIFRTL